MYAHSPRLFARLLYVLAICYSFCGDSNVVLAQEAAVEDPVVKLVRESEPRTASELVYAIKAMTNYGRVDEAIRYQKKLMKLTIGDETMFELNMKYGSDLFIRLRQNPELRPSSAIFAQRLFVGSNRHARNPERIRGLIQQLADENVNRRVEAMTGLMLAREDAIEHLMKGLLDESLSDLHPRMVKTIASMGEVSIEPIQAIVSSGDQASYFKAGAVLHVQKDRNSLPILCMKLLSSKPGSKTEEFTLATLKHVSGSQPTRESAVNFLEFRLNKLKYELKESQDETETRMKWVWDSKKQSLSAQKVSAHISVLDEFVELAKAVHQHDAKQQRNKIRYWMLKIELEKKLAGPFSKLKQADFPNLEMKFAMTLLTKAVKEDRMETAIGTMELIGQMGDATLLNSQDGQPAQVVQMLFQNNDRLRFAATQAIASWDPRSTYSGSSYYLKSLGSLAGVSTERRVLLIEPNGLLADALGGSLNAIGFHTDIYNDGNDFLKQATRRADYDFAVISGAVNRPGTLEVLQRLRRNAFLGDMPVALVGHSDQMSRIKGYAAMDEKVMAFHWPGSRSGMTLISQNMKRFAGRDYIPKDQRIKHAEFALEQLLKVARNEKDYPFYNISQQEEMINRSLYIDGMKEKSIELLGWIATANAQTTLLDIASSLAFDMETKKLAATAFANAIKRRGILLTHNQLQQQFDRYNASEPLSQEVQQHLGSLLDLLENHKENR